MELYLLILAPILISLIIYILPYRKINYLSIVVQIVTLALSLRNLFSVKSTGIPILVSTGGEGIMGISLISDSISSVFVVLVTFLFLIFNIYNSSDYLHDKLFNFLFLTLESLIMLLFLSRDIFNIFISIEISIIISALLIMYKRDSRSIYDGLLYLMINASGMMFFLFGIAVMYKMFGVLDVAALKEALKNSTVKELAIPYALLMVGTGIKCALIPVFSWLPKAHGTPGAPPIVIAVLSGLYIKTSIYLYIRMRDMFSPVIDMDTFFIVVGIVTSIFGFILALCQIDIKMILAYHTISQLGLMMIALSFDNEMAQAGGMFHIINHALFKSLLALSSGSVAKFYKTRNIYEIKGVMKKLPFTGVAILVGILGITGAPLFNGSISKYFIQTGAHDLWWVESFINVINLGTVLSFVKFSNVLKGHPSELIAAKPSSEVRAHSVAMMMLAALCFIAGVNGNAIVNYLFDLDLVIDSALYLKKTMIWLAFIFIGILVYKFIISKLKFFKKGLSIELAYNDVVVTIVVYFFIVLGGVNLMLI